MELDDPDVEFEDARELFHRTLNHLKDKKNPLSITEFNVLMKITNHSDVRTSSLACEFIYYILKMMHPESDSFSSSLKLLAAKARHSSQTTQGAILCNTILKVILEYYRMEMVKGKVGHKLVRENFNEVLGEIFESNTEMASTFLTQMRTIRTDAVFKMFGSVLVQLLFDEIPLPNNYNHEFWKYLGDLNKTQLLFYLLLWVQESNVERFSNVAVMCSRNFFDNYELSSLLISEAFCSYCVTGLYFSSIQDKLYDNLLSLSVSTQNIICMMMILNLDYCVQHQVMDYLKFCEKILIAGQIWKEVALVMKLKLMLFVEKNYCFPHIRKYISSVDLLIDSILFKLKRVQFPRIIDFGIRIVSKRIRRINEAEEVLKLLETVFSSSSAAKDWMDQLVEEPRFTSLQSVFYSLMIYGEDSVREKALAVLNKWKDKNILFVFKYFSMEPNPRLKWNILKMIYSPKFKGNRGKFTSLMSDIHEHALNSELGISLLLRNPVHKHNDKNIIISENTNMEYSTVQAYVLKDVSTEGISTHLDDYLPKINQLVNDWMNQPSGSLIFALAIETMGYLCELEFINARAIWDQLVDILDDNDPVCIMNSFCSFLGSIAPPLKKGQHASYTQKSAKLLWTFMLRGDQVSKAAMRALCEYDIEDFDRTFLECKHSHLSMNENEYSLPHAAIRESCWLQFISSAPVDLCIKLFTRLIEKKCNDPAYKKDNYWSLHRALLMCVEEESKQGPIEIDELVDPLLKICIELLCAKWSRMMLMDSNLMFLYDAYNNCRENVKNKILKIIIQHHHSSSGREVLERLVMDRILTPSSLAFLCSFVDLQLHSKEDTIYIISHGLEHAVGEDFYEMDVRLLKILRNHYVLNYTKKHLTINILKMWRKYSRESKTFQLANKIICQFGNKLNKVLPVYAEDLQTLLKYVDLFTESAKYSKRICHFEICITYGSKYNELQQDILKNLMEVLKSIQNQNHMNNKAWLLEFTGKLNEECDNFLLMVYILCIDVFSGTYLFCPTQTLQSAIDHLALAVRLFYPHPNPKLITDFFMWSETKNVIPVIQEALKISGFALTDAITKMNYSGLIDIETLTNTLI